MTKERKQELIERKHQAEIQMAAIQAMRDRENAEREEKNKIEGQRTIFQPKIRFKTEDHSVVKDMEPFVRQIVMDMKGHVKKISLAKE